MKFITLTHQKTIYFINCDKIHLMSKHEDATWVNLGDLESAFRVDQTPEEIIELINGDNNHIGDINKMGGGEK